MDMLEELNKTLDLLDVIGEGTVFFYEHANVSDEIDACKTILLTTTDALDSIADIIKKYDIELFQNDMQQIIIEVKTKIEKILFLYSKGKEISINDLDVLVDHLVALNDEAARCIVPYVEQL